MSLIPTLGLTWSVGLATTFGHHKGFQYLFVLLAATQVCYNLAVCVEDIQRPFMNMIIF